jgi:hypothetical protein
MRIQIRMTSGNVHVVDVDSMTTLLSEIGGKIESLRDPMYMLPGMKAINVQMIESVEVLPDHPTDH